MIRQMNIEERHAWYRRGRWPCCNGTGYLKGRQDGDRISIQCPRCGTVMKVFDPEDRSHWGMDLSGQMLQVPSGYVPRPIPLLWRLRDFFFKQTMTTSTIFVFGSNLAGRHGKGAALHALKEHGALYGQGEGLQGRSYAIPTKDHGLKALPLNLIEQHVRRFLMFAEAHPELTFEVTPIGCGLAGYTADQIAPMFALTTNNVVLPHEFQAAPGDDTYANENP